MSCTDVTYERQGPVAVITLDRPRYRNAQSRRLISELDGAFADAAADAEVRSIVLTGSGPSFSAGHDLGTPDEREHEQRDPIPTGVVGRTEWSWQWYTEPILRWRDIPKPTVAAIHGHCIFAGWAIASAMDVVVAADDTLIVPHLAEYFALPWIVGPRRAKEILLRNRRLDADDALRLGMASEVVARDALGERAMSIAAEMAETDPALARMVKAELNGLEDQLGFRGAVRSAQASNMLLYFDGATRAGGDGPRRLDTVARALSDDRG